MGGSVDVGVDVGGRECGYGWGCERVLAGQQLPARFWGCSATCCHLRRVLGTQLAPWASAGDTPGATRVCLRISAELLEENQARRRQREKGSFRSKGWSGIGP